MSISECELADPAYVEELLCPCDFGLFGVPHTGGPADLPFPGLQVKGVGNISVPLPDSQVEILKKVTARPPYGKSSEAIVDTRGSGAFLIEPSERTFANKKWDDAVGQLKNQAVSPLGIEGQDVECSLHEMLIHGPGSHSSSHRDIEKVEGVFATLIVQLPSVYKGGELIVRCDNEEVCYNFVEDPKSSTYASYFCCHYADCEREVRPVPEGYRLAFVYNLFWRKSGASRGYHDAPCADLQTSTTESLAEALAARYHQSCTSGTAFLAATFEPISIIIIPGLWSRCAERL